MQKIKKGDDVIVIAGKDKGRRGTVIRVLRDDNRVVVENVNMVKKHVKANPQRGESGGIQEREASLHISNIALYNPATGKGDRVGIKALEDGRRARFFKSNNELVDG
ncbi:MAG: 50S ribosomal protein L24 [Aquisalimonadaceae bacterium]